VAKGFGAGSPILLANRYGLLDPHFFDSLHPIEKALIDNEILNRLIETDNEAIERQRKDSEDKRNLPGLERRLTIEEALERQRQNRDVEVQ
jgi:hypothetical protein